MGRLTADDLQERTRPRAPAALSAAWPPAALPPLLETDEPCTLRSAGGRVRDGRLRLAGTGAAIVAGIGGLELGQRVDLVLPRRGMLRLPAQVAGLGVLGLLLDLRLADRAAWRDALAAMTGALPAVG